MENKPVPLEETKFQPPRLVFCVCDAESRDMGGGALCLRSSPGTLFSGLVSLGGEG